MPFKLEYFISLLQYTLMIFVTNDKACYMITVVGLEPLSSSSGFIVLEYSQKLNEF